MHLELTSREKKLVDRLRKQELRWNRDRWLLIVAGIFGVLCSVFIAIGLLQHIDAMLAVRDDVVSRGWLFGFALLWPKSLILLGCGAFCIIWAIKDWHGNAHRLLLLKLLDAHQSD